MVLALIGHAVLLGWLADAASVALRCDVAPDVSSWCVLSASRAGV